ncbi:EAL domain-containing protein [Pseudoalteromonas sp. NEC-BIFX-2020_015]|uniref:EAL domain-containing protein n=1 Tax=Pseudoalteromonas sp. NEC-BIFX-2020_015 TaxID=2729544 RepID=UPI001461500D|nr:EAL domain-containing protein [Pseudoalteromonas sp. NEC-BIFX-2020_015]NMR26271.1 EAL domain-containing protein [Pseudoalteromonas sp. NEC-BIFX-2020_015]
MKHHSLSYHFIAIFILFVLLFVIGNYASHLATPTKYTIDKTTAIYLKYAYFIDPTKKHSLEQVITQPDAMIYKPFTEIDWNFESRNYWLIIELDNRNTSKEKIVAHFDNPMVDQLNVYHLDKHNNIIHQTTLGDTELGLSLLQYSVPHIRLSLPAQSKQKLVLKIDTTGISKTPVNLYGEAEFQELTRSQTAIWGIFVGVLIMAALYNLVLFFGIRDRVYLVYIGYIISAIILMGAVLGFGFYLWPLSWQLFFHKYIVVSNYAIAFFTLSFCTMFLRYHKEQCWRYKLSLLLLGLMAILAVSCFFIIESIAAPVFFGILVLLYIVCIILIYKKLRSGFRWAKFYVISWIPLIIGAAIQPLELTGVLPYSFATRHAFLAAILCEVILMAMALADRVRYQRERALYHATHTQQTKLLNSAMLKQAYMNLEQEQRPNTICLIKLRYFNSLNTILSPSQANGLIIHVAKALELQLSNERQFINLDFNLDSSSKIVDLGTGIFACISTKTQSGESLSLYLNKTVKSLPKQYEVQGLNLQLKYAVGISFSKTNGNFEASLQRGYLTLKQAKNSTSNISNSQQNTHITMDIGLAAKLQQAIKSNQLAMYHQPQINVRTNQVIGSEVLLRWPTPEHQHINIEELILLAERTGLINELTLWVIEQACQDIVELNKHGFNEHTVSVNLSAKNLSINKLAEKIENALLTYNIPAKQLKFELTETALVENQQQMKSFMGQLQKLGVHVILDDFGTGYSSLNYLVNYTFSNLKIDKSFVLDLTTNQSHQVIVKTAIDMAHNLGLSVTVEGVEDKGTHQLLIEMGANNTQGYYYSKAIPITDYLQWLRAC